MKKLLTSALAIILLASCATTKTRFLQGDVIGFSNEVDASYKCPRGMFSFLKKQNRGWNLLEENEKNNMRQQLKTRSIGQNVGCFEVCIRQ